MPIGESSLPSPTALLLMPSGRAIEVTRCAITRCREIMTPQLSIVKTRFAKASLRPRCARHRSWNSTCRLPNGCVGHSATQWLRWTLSYPVHETDRRARLPMGVVVPTGDAPLDCGCLLSACNCGNCCVRSLSDRSCSCSEAGEGVTVRLMACSAGRGNCQGVS